MSRVYVEYEDSGSEKFTSEESENVVASNKNLNKKKCFKVL